MVNWYLMYIHLHLLGDEMEMMVVKGSLPAVKVWKLNKKGMKLKKPIEITEQQDKKRTTKTPQYAL